MADQAPRTVRRVGRSACGMAIVGLLHSVAQQHTALQPRMVHQG